MASKIEVSRGPVSPPLWQEACSTIFKIPCIGACIWNAMDSAAPLLGRVAFGALATVLVGESLCRVEKINDYSLTQLGVQGARYTAGVFAITTALDVSKGDPLSLLEKVGRVGVMLMGIGSVVCSIYSLEPILNDGLSKLDSQMNKASVSIPEKFPSTGESEKQTSKIKNKSLFQKITSFIYAPFKWIYESLFSLFGLFTKKSEIEK